MASRNVETFRNSHDCFNRRDFDGLLKTLNDNCTYHEHSRNTIFSGKKQFREFLQEWVHGFSDGRVTNPTYIDAGDTVISQFTFEGMNDGKFLGMPATMRHVSIPVCEIARYDSQGKVVSAGVYYDQMSIGIQLGLMKPLATAA